MPLPASYGRLLTVWWTRVRWSTGDHQERERFWAVDWWVPCPNYWTIRSGAGRPFEWIWTFVIWKNLSTYKGIPVELDALYMRWCDFQIPFAFFINITTSFLDQFLPFNDSAQFILMEIKLRSHELSIHDRARCARLVSVIYYEVGISRLLSIRPLRGIQYL